MNANPSWTERAKALEPAIVEVCTLIPVSAGPGALTKELARHLPELHFRRTLCRGGWYRLGGVLAADGTRVSDDLQSWVEMALDACDGDFEILREEYADKGLIATRRVGRTHYFIAQTGDKPGDFLQLEIEDLQETQAHKLFAQTPAPTQLEELVDPNLGHHNGQPIGLPCYTFRRLTHVGDLLARIRQQKPEAQPIHRFAEDWGNSSAGHATSLGNQWIIAVREHLDRFRQTIIRAQPVPAIDGEAPVFGAREGTRELALHDALVAFDRAAGYPFAWYFHMLTTKAVPHWVARVVVEDAMAGFAYLPRRDEEVVRHWLHAPYAL
jgi:hypothetical protein